MSKCRPGSADQGFSELMYKVRREFLQSENVVNLPPEAEQTHVLVAEPLSEAAPSAGIRVGVLLGIDRDSVLEWSQAHLDLARDFFRGADLSPETFNDIVLLALSTEV